MKAYRSRAACLIIEASSDDLRWAIVVQPNETYSVVSHGSCKANGSYLIVGLPPNLPGEIDDDEIVRLWEGWDDLSEWEGVDTREVIWVCDKRVQSDNQ